LYGSRSEWRGKHGAEAVMAATELGALERGAAAGHFIVSSVLRRFKWLSSRRYGHDMGAGAVATCARAGSQWRKVVGPTDRCACDTWLRPKGSTRIAHSNLGTTHEPAIAGPPRCARAAAEPTWRARGYVARAARSNVKQLRVSTVRPQITRDFETKVPKQVYNKFVHHLILYNFYKGRWVVYSTGFA
jgi:hypothetical protein